MSPGTIGCHWVSIVVAYNKVEILAVDKSK